MAHFVQKKLEYLISRMQDQLKNHTGWRNGPLHKGIISRDTNMKSM